MFGGSGAKGRGWNYVYGSFSCLKPRWRKAKRISHKAMVCAVAMTTKHKGQALHSEGLPNTSRNQTADATVYTALAREQLHLSFQKECL